MLEELSDSLRLIDSGICLMIGGECWISMLMGVSFSFYKVQICLSLSLVLHLRNFLFLGLYIVYHCNIYIYIYIYIYIIIMSRYQHRSPRPSLPARLYRPLLPGGLQGYILYRHRAVVYKFSLVVLPLLVHVKGPQEYVTYEFILTSPAVSRMSGSSNVDSFRDGW